MNHNQHSFEADTIVDALAQVRNTLGPEAVILETRRIKPFPLLGLGRGKVRVLAGLQDNSSRVAEMLSELKALRGEMNSISAGRPAAETPRRKAKPAGRNPLLARAIAAGLSAEGAGRLEQLLAGTVPDADTLADLLAPGIRTLDVLESPGVIMLAGTTGVGKTTTLAKVAARFSCSEDREAALISKDAFRIGAMDQLRTYAELLNLPFEAAFSARDLAAAVRKHAAKHAVFIDTAGRSPSDSEQLRELGALAASIPSSRVLLTVSLAQARDAARIMKSFAPLKPCGLVVTKLDETRLQWGLLDILHATGLPLAFTTFGQKVPEDISLAEPGAVASMLAESLLEDF